MARIGRPPTPADKQVTVIRLQKQHVEMLDQVIRERAERDLRAVVTTDPERKIPGTDTTTWKSRIEEPNYSSERRKLVAILIEQELTNDELYPTRVLPKVPRGIYSDIELVEISDWAEKASAHMDESAPLAVKRVLIQNKLRKMERDLPPEEYIEKLSRVTQDVTDERRGPNADEETP